MDYELRHSTSKGISSGTPSPLGASLTKKGVNFAVYSKYADQIFLLLFDKSNDRIPTDIIQLKKTRLHIWHAEVTGIGAGQLYAYKAVGRYEPQQGFRFNENKLLIDPYAKALTGKHGKEEHLLVPFDPRKGKKELIKSSLDDSDIVPKSVVVDDSFDWQSDRHPRIPLDRLIVYETHLKGFTAHASSHVRHPGTYTGFIKKIPYLIELGVNAVELLPVHDFYIRRFLREKGLTEYWGYNSIAYFSPEWSYSTKSHPGCQVNEFKTLVRELHKAGIEIILDVVYNHSGEGNELGPTLCFRGIDNQSYYLLRGDEKEPYRYYVNDTGCGNTVNIDNKMVRTLVLDSLRYWVKEMHVDGFRFDLATVLGRHKGKFSKDAPFFNEISRDPVLSGIKLIAEPWDMVTYELGNFPIGWCEWNDKFRDTVRLFNRGENGQLRDLAYRLTGSSDLFNDDGRRPNHSINFITAHDGFTLYDLYSYNQKHNDMNHEDNRDGSDHNHSWNCGVEGPSNDPNVTKLRRKMIKNALCLLLLSSGTPMILGGDEFCRTKRGNNNSYAQDNEINWIDWSFRKKNSEIFEFCQHLIDFRKEHAILRREIFFSGKDEDLDQIPDIQWFDKNLNPINWHDDSIKLFAYQLDGSESVTALGNYHLFFILNSESESQTVHLPYHPGMHWHVIIDTSKRQGHDFKLLSDSEIVAETMNVADHSIIVLIGI